MFNKKDYKKFKRKYIEERLKGNLNLFTFFTQQQSNFLMEYYEKYTIYLFNKLTGSLRLGVSKHKIAVLNKLKGEGDWMFAGMRDHGNERVSCELGHSLRYAFKAINRSSGNSLIFGSTCVGDFFDLDVEAIKALTKLQDTMQKELKLMVTIMETKRYQEYYTYECGNLGRFISVFGADAIVELPDSNIKATVLSFLRLGLPIPITLAEQYTLPEDCLEYVGFGKFERDYFNSDNNTSIFLHNLYSDIHRYLLRRLSSEDEYDYFDYDKEKEGIGNYKILQENISKRKDLLFKLGNLTNLWATEGLSVNFIDMYEFRKKLKNPIRKEVEDCLYFLSTYTCRDDDIVNFKLRARDLNLLCCVNYRMNLAYAYELDYYYNLANRPDIKRDIIAHSKELEETVAQMYYLIKQEEIARETRITERTKVKEYLENNLTNENRLTIRGGNIAYDMLIERKLDVVKWSENQYYWLKEAYRELKESIEAEEKGIIQNNSINTSGSLGLNPDIEHKIKELTLWNKQNKVDTFVMDVINTVVTTKRLTPKQKNVIIRGHKKAKKML